MELTPYLDTLRRDLVASAAPAGEPAARTAELLAGALDASARLCLMEALSDAAAEITSKLDGTSIDVRLRGRDADIVVTPVPTGDPSAGQAPPSFEGGDLTRITLRVPEPLKDQVEQMAAAEGISVNAWLVRAITQAVHVGAWPGPGHGPAQWSAEWPTPGPGPRPPFGPPPMPPMPPQPPAPPRPPGRGRRMTGYAQA